MTAAHWRDIGAANARHEAARATSQRSGVVLEITDRPIMGLPPLSVWLAGAAVWLFVGFIVALAIAVTG